MAAEKAKARRDEVARDQAIIAKILEADAKKPKATISKDNAFYQMYVARAGKKAEG